jgi:hypothetical protein
LAAVKLTTDEAAIVGNYDPLCKAWNDRGLAYSAQGRIFNNMLYVWYLHLTKAKPIHERQTYPLVREHIT